jgi:tetratricopeptide (TPR) repeat protein
LKALPPQLTATSNVQTQLGLLYLLKQDLPNARKAFEAALTVEPTNVEALRGLTRLDFAAKNGAAAQTRIDGALARDPKSPGLLVLSAQSNLRLGKKDEAERLLKLSIESDPQNLEAYSMLGRIYGTENRLDEAISQFEQLSAHKTTAVMGHTMIGMLLEMQKRPDAARQRYEQALSVDPNAGVAANNLAMILVQGGGNLDTALKLAQTARSQLPNVGDASDTLGLVYYRKGLAPLAVDAFQESVNKEPNNPAFLAHLGLAYAKSGETAKARESLKKAFAISSNFPDADEARSTLATLVNGRGGGNGSGAFGR